MKLSDLNDSTLTEGVIDWMGRKLRVKTTKGKPTKSDAPKWAKYLGKTPLGAYHWLSNDSVVENDTSDSYFPDAKKVEFSGFEGKKDNKGSVERL